MANRDSSKRKLASVFKGSGLSENKIKQRAENRSNRSDPLTVIFRDEETQTLQFVADPLDKRADGFKEFEQHIWKEGAKRWYFIPCIGDGCELCEDEDDQIAKTSDGFAAQVWSFKDKKMMVLTGGDNLATKIIYKYRKAPERFTRRVWDITRLPTSPKSFEVEISENAQPIRLSGREPVDLSTYLADRYESYIRSIGGNRRRSTLDEEDGEEGYEDEEEIEEEDAPTRAQMLKMEWAELKRYAKSMGITEKITNRRELIDVIEETLEEEV